MKLIEIAKSIIIENEEGNVSVDKKMTEKTVNDVFTLNDVGLEYVKVQLAKINKKAARIGVKPLELKIVGEGSYKHTSDRSKREMIVKTYDVKVEGTPPIIDGYEFIASIEHSDAGNIINISPAASVKELPAEYRTSNTDCDYCHTKRDRLNTFVLRETATNKFKKVGRSCLKNFLPGKNPASILGYAEILSKLLGSLVGGESAEPDSDFGGGGGYSKYYDADTFMRYVCAAYFLNGQRYTTGKAARENPGLTSTPILAMNLMNMRWQPDDFKEKYKDKLDSIMPKADALAKEMEDWAESKDWDAEIQSAKPESANYLHNLKTLSKSSAIQYKNSGTHASLLLGYLQEKDRKEKQAAEKEAAKTKTYVGKIGDRITFIGTLKKQSTYNTNYGYRVGTGYRYLFEDIDNQNHILLFTSVDFNLQDGESYKVENVQVKKHEPPSQYSRFPQTIIGVIARVSKIVPA